ncbi:hypothetical protein C0991_007446 [Blastosporella zonata]|nr:hypothetical protein C0991_007446 [Blastosporella zonata]
MLLACPCGAELHSRLSLYKMRAIIKQEPHPSPTESPHTDDDQVAISAGRKPKLARKGQKKELSPSNSPQARPHDGISLGQSSVSDPIEQPVAESVSEEIGPLELWQRNYSSGSESDDDGLIDDEDAENWVADVEYLSERPALDASEEEAQRALHTLSNYHLSVDPIFNRVVCDFCHSLVSFQRVHTHAQKHTVGKKTNLPLENRIPPKPELHALLRVLGADKPVDLGTTSIPPFEGFQILDGFKCKVAGCRTSHIITSSRRMFREHVKKEHPGHAGDAPFEKVRCQALSSYRREREIREVTHEPVYHGDLLEAILRRSESIGLDRVSLTYEMSPNMHQRSLVYSFTSWDRLIQGVDIAELRRTTDVPKPDEEAYLVRLIVCVEKYYRRAAAELERLDLLTRRMIRSADPQKFLENDPFRLPQEAKTVNEYAQFVARFLIFLIRHMQMPVARFEVSLHSDTLHHLTQLSERLGNPQPSSEFAKDATKDPFSKYLLTYHLQDNEGTPAHASAYPHNISCAQWGFRATACWEILLALEETNVSAFCIYQDRIKPWIHEDYPHIFNSLRQSMHLLTSLSMKQPLAPQFSWDPTNSILSFQGYPIKMSTFRAGLQTALRKADELVQKLFRGLPTAEILAHIDSRLDPACPENWFQDMPRNNDVKFSIFSNSKNSFKYGKTLIAHLSKDQHLVRLMRASIQGQRGM